MFCMETERSGSIADAMENTNIFLTFEDVEFDKSKKLPTIYPDLTQEERNQKYLALVSEAFEAQTAEMTAEEREIRADGVKYETNVVTSTIPNRIAKHRGAWSTWAACPPYRAAP